MSIVTRTNRPPLVLSSPLVTSLGASLGLPPPNVAAVINGLNTVLQGVVEDTSARFPSLYPAGQYSSLLGYQTDTGNLYLSVLVAGVWTWVQIMTGGGPTTPVVTNITLNVDVASLGQPPGGSIDLFRFTCTNAMTFAINMAGSEGGVVSNPTSAITWHVAKNAASPWGTVNISTGGVMTFTNGTAQSYAVGDVFRLIGSASADATLAGVNCAFLASLTNPPPPTLPAICWLGTIPASQHLLAYRFTSGATYPANWSGSQAGMQVNPTATWTANIQKNTSAYGTVSISTGGVATLATSGGLPAVFAVGDLLDVFAPSSADATAAGFSCTFANWLG